MKLSLSLLLLLLLNMVFINILIINFVEGNTGQKKKGKRNSMNFQIFGMTKKLGQKEQI